MKTFRLLIIVGLVAGLSVMSGCSRFKKNQNAGDIEAAQTAGLAEDGWGGEAISSANRLKAPYNQSYYFDLNKYDVKAGDIESINVQANYLVTHPNAKIRLEGNADERGSREYNITLGWKRARAAAELLKQQGVTDAQIALVSFGKEKPVAFGHDEESYSLNRRVDLIYEAK